MYKLAKDKYGDVVCVVREDGACIPFDPDNRDYAEYLEWLAEGNEPLPADEPVEE